MFTYADASAFFALRLPPKEFTYAAAFAVLATKFVYHMFTYADAFAVFAAILLLPMFTYGFPATLFTIRLLLANEGIFSGCVASLGAVQVEVTQSPWSRQASQQAKTPQVVSRCAGKWAYA